MPDRLQELIQQRRLIEEHLAWLNREIAATVPSLVRSDVSKSPARPTETLGAAAGAVANAALQKENLPTTEALEVADSILAEYEQNPENLTQNVKRGCLLYFAAAMAILLLGVCLLYLNYVNRSRSAPPSHSSTPPLESP